MVTPLTRIDYPTSLWTQGSLVQGKVVLRVASLTVAQGGRLEIALITQAGDVVGQPVLLDAHLPIVPWPFVTDLPPISFPHPADFGDPPLIHLPGYDLSATTAQPGDTLNLAWYWQAGQNIRAHYLVLMDLREAEGNLVAQADCMPGKGAGLTCSCRHN